MQIRLLFLLVLIEDGPVHLIRAHDLIQAANLIISNNCIRRESNIITESSLVLISCHLVKAFRYRVRFLVDANNTPKPSVATLLLECDDTGHVSANPDSLLDDLIVLTLGGQLRLTYSYFLAFIWKRM